MEQRVIFLFFLRRHFPKSSVTCHPIESTPEQLDVWCEQTSPQYVSKEDYLKEQLHSALYRFRHFYPSVHLDLTSSCTVFSVHWPVWRNGLFFIMFFVVFTILLTPPLPCFGSHWPQSIQTRPKLNEGTPWQHLIQLIQCSWSPPVLKGSGKSTRTNTF